jgi:hypothetical protein
MMNRLLRLCVLAALVLYAGVAFIGATPVFVRLPCPILIPSSYPSTGSNLLITWTGTNLTSDSHRVALMFKVPGRGNTPDTITLFGVYVRNTSSIPAGDSLITCTLYTVKGGVPEVAPSIPAVLYHPATPHGGTAQSYSSTDLAYIAFGTAAVCTAGQTIAAVVRRSSGSTNTITVSHSWASTSAASQMFPLVATKAAAAVWARVNAIPAIGLRYSDYSTIASYLDGGMAVESLFTNTCDSNGSYGSFDEIGNQMRFPFPMKVIGAWAALSQGAAAFKGQLSLYDTTGTNGTLIAAATFNDTVNASANTETATKYLYWGGEVTLNANQLYYLAVTPLDTTNITVYSYSCFSNSAMVYGRHITEIYRNDGGAWTNINNRVVPHMGLIVSQLSAGQEGGVSGRRRRILGTELDTVFLGMTEVEERMR